MAQCNPPITISTVYDCGVICSKWNDAPLPKFEYKKFRLIQKSEFFDSGVIQDREFKWQFFLQEDFLLYETAWGKLNDLIPNLSFSTYGSLLLGYNYQNIINFLELTPSTSLTQSDTITVRLEVKDCDGIKSTMKSNKYKFNKQ